MNDIPFDEVRAWVFQSALPFWAASGVDRKYGGFLEELSADGQETGCSFKRTRTMCRQTYVFSHAALLGFEPGAALSALGFEYLVSKARLETGGWVKTLSREGAVIDATADLYDLAFVLFAMAWRYRASGDSRAIQCAHETLDFIQTRMARDEGFVSRLPDDGVRLQNPHMHLAEACLAAFEASQDERFLDQGRQIVTLFRKRLFDGTVLSEVFDAEWRPAPNQALEPGHHFEWAWILAQYKRLAGEGLAKEAGALVAFAEAGLDASGKVYDAVDRAGAPLEASSRAWTNTERIKGWLGLSEMTGVDPSGAVTNAARLLFDRYMAGALPGAWVDQFDAENRPMTANVPASIVYHLMLAFSEVLRFEGRGA